MRKRSICIVLVLGLVALGVCAMALSHLARRRFANSEASRFVSEINAYYEDMALGDTRDISVRLDNADSLVYVVPYRSKEELNEKFSADLSDALHHIVGNVDTTAPAFFWIRNERVVARSAPFPFCHLGGPAIFVWHGKDTVTITVAKVEDADGVWLIFKN